MIRFIASAVIVLVSLLCPSLAGAYPQWQFSTGTTRCNQCHYSPAGGGLLTSYGRDANGEDLSTWKGDGSFMHGAVDLPTFLKLGLDARFAAVNNDNGGPDQPKTAFFPMQFDAHVRLEAGAFAFQAIGGVRGQLRRGDAPIPASNVDPENGSRLLSREHWAIWQPAAQGLYVRAGRYFAPFGLRLAEHVVYVRRDLGFNLFEETYNLSVGFLNNDWEGHLTAFAPDFLQGGNQSAGAAAYAEKRLLDERAGVGVQAKYSVSGDVKRAVGGVVGKAFVEPARTLFMMEANYVQQMPEQSEGVGQFVGLLGGSWLPPIPGGLASLWVERIQTDVRTSGTAITAGSAVISWFPYPHWELQLVERLQQADGGNRVNTFLAQIHYFL